MNQPCGSPLPESPPDFYRADSLAASAIVLVLLTVAQRAIGLGRGLLFCRWLDPAELGEWDLAYGFLLLAAPLAVLGLPGSFGRYVEKYRQRGQLRQFLLRTTALAGVLSLAAVGGTFALAEPCSVLLFGRPDYAAQTRILALVLGAVIVQNFLVSLLTALRRVRLVSCMQLASGVLFAVLGCAAVALGRGPQAVVAAFGVATLASSCWALWRIRHFWGAIPAAGTPLTHSTLWCQLLPFAFWVWVSNWLANVFALADRYILLHYSGLPESQALELVGQYHSSRLLPLMFVGLAELLAAMMLPHLSRDWEAGRQEFVIRRLNFFLKICGIALASGGAVVLAASPLVFSGALDGKYSSGWHVLPWTLAYCSLAGLVVTAQNYLWCAERPRTATLPLMAAVAVNIGLSAMLVPAYGLQGAVWGASIATLVSLAGTGFVAARLGMRFYPTTICLMAAPLTLLAGPIASTVALVGLIALAGATTWLLSDWEREQIAAFASKLPGLGRRRKMLGENRPLCGIPALNREPTPDLSSNDSTDFAPTLTTVP